MALVHAQPLDVISVRPLGVQLAQAKTHSLLKTHKLQLIRVVLAAGQLMPEHHVPGEVTIQCLEGKLRVTSPSRVCSLEAGEMMALPADAPHALQAQTDVSLLLTILLHQ
jgi:quercetin dioxygenase-like cupin family protein